MALRQLAEIAGQRVGGLLALQVGERLDAGVVIAHDQHGGRRDVRIRKVVFLFARVGDAHLIDHRVVTLGVQAGDEAVPLTFHELRFDAQAFGNGAPNLYIKTGKLPRCVVEGEGGVGAFGANLEGARGLDLVQPGLGMGGTQGGGLDQAGDEQRA
ncbi:hypothetical protein D3C87_1656070 [compost metagenome]